MRKRSLVLAFFLVSSLILGIFSWQWQRFESMAGQAGGSLPASKPAGKLPRIDTLNRRLKQGEKIAISQLASASDIDGRNLSGELRCYDEKGRQILDRFDTGKPGQWTLTWEVVSALTGRRVRKRSIVLVDGRIGS